MDESYLVHIDTGHIIESEQAVIGVANVKAHATSIQNALIS